MGSLGQQWSGQLSDPIKTKIGISSGDIGEKRSTNWGRGSLTGKTYLYGSKLGGIWAIN